ncbi:MAG: hypothetical protein HQ508_00860 [Candidatus Marinimicrobia bacterium]|nr:hypothetical protein [Candidatus Neomarinimicrobiota bacterium]
MTTQNFIRKALILFSSLLISIAAWGQGKPQNHPPQDNRQQIEQVIEDLSSELSLSAGQKAQITILFKAHFEEMDEMSSQSGKGQRPDRQIMDKYRKAFEVKVKDVLTKDQAAAFDAFQKSHGPQSDQRRPRSK